MKAQTLRLEALGALLQLQTQGEIYVISGPGFLVQLANPAIVQGLTEVAEAPREHVARVTVEIHPVIKDALS